MIDLTSELGRRAEARLQTELVIWLTTVAASGVPQPRPVWFLWDGSAVLIYSQPAAKKLAHIAQNPQVALHFNSTPDGDDIQVLLATATMSRTPPLVRDIAAYVDKYRASMADIGTTADRMSAEYSVLLRAVPTRLRGMA